MMTMRSVMLERHGRSLPIVNGVPAYPIKPAPAIRADPCNNGKANTVACGSGLPRLLPYMAPLLPLQSLSSAASGCGVSGMQIEVVMATL
jgi:hypothetical protein